MAVTDGIGWVGAMPGAPGPVVGAPSGLLLAAATATLALALGLASTTATVSATIPPVASAATVGTASPTSGHGRDLRLILHCEGGQGFVEFSLAVGGDCRDCRHIDGLVGEEDFVSVLENSLVSVLIKSPVTNMGVNVTWKFHCPDC